jgi:hypothetical protein
MGQRIAALHALGPGKNQPPRFSMSILLAEMPSLLLVDPLKEARAVPRRAHACGCCQVAHLVFRVCAASTAVNTFTQDHQLGYCALDLWVGSEWTVRGCSVCRVRRPVCV